MSDFALLLRTSRKAAGLSQEDAARVLGVQPSTVSRWERCAHEPHPLQARVARQQMAVWLRETPDIDRRRG